MKKKPDYGYLSCRFGSLKAEIQAAAAARNWKVAKFLRYAIAQQIAAENARQSEQVGNE